MTKEEFEKLLEQYETPISDSLIGILSGKPKTSKEIRDERVKNSK